ncbi:hypothetical protein BaRGS_00037066, partial [Batillaria attramentaria]
MLVSMRPDCSVGYPRRPEVGHFVIPGTNLIILPYVFNHVPHPSQIWTCVASLIQASPLLLSVWFCCSTFTSD